MGLRFALVLALVTIAAATAAPTASADACVDLIQNSSCGACPTNDVHVHIDRAGPNLVCVNILGIRLP